MASRFGPNPSSPKAKEELIVVVACQECTQITGFALKANKTKEESVVADVPFTPGPPFPMHLLLRGKWKRRRELLLTTAPQAGRHEKLSVELTVSCVVAVASANGLVTVSIAINSIILVFGNAIILLLILFVLFGWRELLGEFSKNRSAAK